MNQNNPEIQACIDACLDCYKTCLGDAMGRNEREARRVVGDVAWEGWAER